MLLRKTWFVLLLVFFVPHAFGQTAIEGLYQPSAGEGFLGPEFSYTLYIPAGYDEPDASFPIIVNMLGVSSQLVSVVRGDEYPGFLLVADTRHFSVTDLIEQLESEYDAINSDQRFITGFSSGAFAAFGVIGERPDFFDAAIPIAGGNPFGQVAPDVRTWVFHGREDSIVDPALSRSAVDAIQEAGGSPLYLELNREAHGPPGRVFQMPEVFDWLFYETPPDLAMLNYDPETGNLQLDASRDSLWSFSLQSDLDLSQAIVSDIAGSPLTSTESRLRYRATIDDQFDGTIDFGNVLPAGLNRVSFHEAVQAQYKRTGNGANRDVLVNILRTPYDGPGDFNSDDVLTAADVDLLASAIRAMVDDPQFDLNEDGVLNLADHAFWIEEVAEVPVGDADLNGGVDFRDFLALSGSFNEPSGWASGDFDGNGTVEFSDFLLLSANFTFNEGPFASVPEPQHDRMLPLLIVLLALMRRRAPAASRMPLRSNS